MKLTITKKHEYLSGWTLYDMTWKTDYSGIRNMTLQSVVVVTKEPFSSKTLKTWMAGKGVDLDEIFTIRENAKEDCEKMNQLVGDFNRDFGGGLEELNSDNKCHVRYSATLNPNYRPLKTAFETIEAYDVRVLIEYKSGVIDGVFPSQGRKKSESCPFILISGGEMKELYGEEDAIEKVKARIERYVEDCDTDEKYNALTKKLESVRKELWKYR
jgi:hypothetical protein